MSNAVDRPYGGAPGYGRDPAPLHNAESLAIEVWAGRTVEEAQRGRRVAWIVTGLLILICAAQAAAIAIMLPLKEVQPYTILVDRQTGYVETVRGVRLGELAEDEALVHAFLAQYLLARETFDPADFKDRYTRVALWSAEQARTDYVGAYQPGAQGGVLAEMRPGTLVTAKVKNIELMGPNLARVRFETTRRDPGMEAIRQDYQAIIGYRFVGAPMRMEDRLINPLGFQVITYRRDAEAAPVAAAPAPEAPQPIGLVPTPPSAAKADPGAEPPAPKPATPAVAKPDPPKPAEPAPPPAAPAAKPPPPEPQDIEP